MGFFDGRKIDRLISSGSSAEVAFFADELYDRGDYDGYARLWIGFARRMESEPDPDNTNTWTRVGRIYECGIGVYRDMAAAYYWYHKAANCGSFSDEEACYKAGYFLENGIGVRADLDEAIKYYRRGASNGSSQAREALSRLGVFGY